ncbi:50S ribosomal protein L6 [Tautonia sociabilis]|uniref:Large ribosomal subunit protein uL6 n=1 Tax=Tautonia sociabilis TaxID=2080755 RepID=A0A432MGA0_9BACT|nr:50S ribosomal protein L6 [Tautonia sociabilis]RUL85400.1 50S ribosomal protein L6 [Tautonia sociabilis]
MSRIGRLPIPVPDSVKISLDGSTIQVEGPKGKLSFSFREEMRVTHDAVAKEIRVERPDDERMNKALHGLTRTLIANMVKGVTEGYTKRLEIVGVGYQAQLKGANAVNLQVGFANQILMQAPEGVTVTVPDATHIQITGADKQAVGEFAARIRRVRPPEPYKGKGIRYEGEQVRRKAGKAFGK